MKTRWRGYGFALAGSLIAIWVSLVAALLLTFHPVASDWNTYYDTARALRASPHADLWNYATTAWGGAQPGGCSLWPNLPYKYPPLLVILIAPLAFLPCSAATLVWRIVTLALWGVCAFALAGPAWRAGERWWALAAVAMVTIYLPLIDGMLLGQAHLVILAIIFGGIALITRGRDRWGGGILAFGAWIKYAPAVVILYYLLTGRWRIAIGAAVAGIALLLAQLAIVGPASLLKSLSPGMLATTGAVWDGWPGGALWGIAASVIFAVGVVSTHRKSLSKGDEALGIGWALCAMLLASPVIQWLYLTWLLPAFWACLIETTRIARGAVSIGDWRRWTPLAALALIFAISLIPFNHIANSVTIIGLWLLCGALYLRSAGLLIPALWPRAATPTSQNG